MKPTTKRSVKLYQGLSAKQLAILNFESAADQDADEIDKIRSAVPWKQYNCIDAEFTDWRDAWHSVVMVWACETWRQLFLYSSLVNRLQGQQDDSVTLDGSDAFDTTIGHLHVQRERQAALSRVMYDLCNQHGVDYDAVIKFTAVPDRHNPLDEIDEQFYRRWLDDLNQCLPDN